MKKAFLISAYFIASVLLGILWYFPVVPYLFYTTFADDVMRDQMRGDLIEFYGIAQETQWFISEGDPVSMAEKISSVMEYIGMYGFWVWILLGILLAYRRVRSKRHQIKPSLVQI